MNAAEEVWKTILSLLEQEMTSTAVATWFSDLEPVLLEGDRFVLCCPSAVRCNIIRSRYLPTLEKAFYELFSEQIRVELVDPEQKKREFSPQGHANVLLGSEQYTFDRFVVGDSNRSAYNAARAVADSPGGVSDRYNPLFLWGDSGLGKTHLMYAIYHSLHQSHPEFQMVFVKGEQFTNDLNEAIRNKTTDQFRNKYRDKDVLMVDDIQFIAGKEYAQVEFFNTFNNLYEAGHQIVLTSDRPPSDMPRLEERLRSRFEWGLMMDIKPPDFETRLAIVQEKANQLGLELSMPVLELIAKSITANVRQLEGTVKKLLAYKEMENGKMDTDAVMRAVRDLIRDNQSFAPSPEVIIEETGKCYGIEVSDIMSGSRTKEITLARQVAMYITRQQTQLSLPEIGKVFDRDHSTIIHSLQKVETLKAEDRETAEIIRDIISNINSRTY